MKTVVLLFAFVIVITVSTSAQLDKGYWIGSVEGGLKKDINSRSWAANLNPQVMKLVCKNLAVGIGIDFRYANIRSYNYFQPNTHTVLSKSLSFDIGPIARKYFLVILLNPILN